MLRVIEAAGDYYECGRIFGEACRESIVYRLDLQIPNDLVEKHKTTLKEVNERCEKWYPEYIRNC